MCFLFLLGALRRTVNGLKRPRFRLWLQVPWWKFPWNILWFSSNIGKWPGDFTSLFDFLAIWRKTIVCAIGREIQYRYNNYKLSIIYTFNSYRNMNRKKHIFTLRDSRCMYLCRTPSKKVPPNVTPGSPSNNVPWPVKGKLFAEEEWTLGLT